MKKYLLPILAVTVIVIVGITWFTLRSSEDDQSSQNITSFEECINAGNPAMESYPRQCAANGQTFTEQLDNAGPKPAWPGN